MSRTFTQALQQIALESPQRITVTLLHRKSAPQTISYQKLFYGAAAYAQALEQAGIQPKEVVIIILDYGDALLYAFWGCILRGAIPSIMPFLTEKLSPEHYRKALQALIDISSPSAIITYADFLPEVQQAVQPHTSVRAILDSASIPSLTPFHIDKAMPQDTTYMKGLSAQEDDIVLLQHSSGTTGLQKGVALSHRAVFNQLESYAQAIDLKADKDVIVSWLPLYHDMGLIAGFIMPILCRVPLVLMSPFEWVRAPLMLFHAISTYKGTLTWLPNFAYHFCSQKTREADMEGVDLSSLRAVINCSEPMYQYSHEMFLARFRPYGLREQALATCYAMAENVFAVTQGGIHEQVNIDTISQAAFTNTHTAKPAEAGDVILPMVSAGKPIPQVEVRVLHEKTHHPLPERQVGEIALRSNCMLSSYYHRADATAEAFHEGWLLTGDLGYIANGEVYISGRKKDLIIVGGKNVYSRDLENIVNDVEGVHNGRVAAFGMPNQLSGTEDVIIVAEEEENNSNREEIAEVVRLAIAKSTDVIVRQVHIVERGWLLKTSSGKVSRSANREKYLAEMDK